MGKRFRAYDLDQQLLLPPDLREWVPRGHLAEFISDVVEQLDLSAILQPYDEGEQRGQPPYHPALMVKLLIYGYCTGRMSSRKLEQASYEEVAVRMLTCDQQPDHASIAEFRKRHLSALSALFVQVLRLCEKAGLVKLGRVAIDGTKLKANAAKRRSHSYQRLNQMERELEAEVKRLLREAERIDAQEDREYGVGRRGDELPEELRDRQTRLAKIKAAKADLEREAEEAEAAARAEQAEQKERRAAGEEVIVHKSQPKWVKTEEGAIEPPPKRQRNLTDPDARLMKDPMAGVFLQGYNAQIAVDDQAQIIVAAEVTQAANDMNQLVPTLLLVEENLGRMPEKVVADAGYFSPAGIADQRIAGVDLYIPPNRIAEPKGVGLERKKGPPKAKANAAIRAAMRKKLDQPEGDRIYRGRNQIVEPVFAQTKHVRGFRQFLLRGAKQVNAEWSLVCMTHNLLKLFRLNPASVTG